MSNANPKASSAAREGAPDTQTLIALLEDLMPLLLSIQQAQTFQHAQTFGPVPPRPDLGNVLLPNAMLDHQAALALVEDITADPLRRLSAYLEAHAGQHAELQSCVGIVTQAVHCFAAREYAQTFGLVWQAYRMIAALRAINPQLPPLHTAGPAGSSAAPPTTSIH